LGLPTINRDGDHDDCSVDESPYLADKTETDTDLYQSILAIARRENPEIIKYLSGLREGYSQRELAKIHGDNFNDVTKTIRQFRETLRLQL